MSYRLRKVPDPILRETMPEFEFGVDSIDDLKHLLTWMRMTLKVKGGIGLAANQIGSRVRLICWNIPGSVGYAVNPELHDLAGEQRGTEGCLSIPGKTGRISRPLSGALSGRLMSGDHFNIPAQGHLLRVLCHEIDHLNGILWTDHLNGAGL
jgi:peptide deformylase